MQLWLASTSPRRAALLKTLGLPFQIVAPRFEEHPTGRTPEAEALFFAAEKAKSVADLCPASRVIGSDTLIDCDGETIGKPRDSHEAKEILKKLSGRTHTVITAVVLLNTASGEMQTAVGRTAVTFRNITPDEIVRYVATGEPMGKAGAYAIQENGRQFVTRINGDEDVVVGLPLAPLRQWLLQR